MRVYHLMRADDSSTPITSMTAQELEDALNFCTQRDCVFTPPLTREGVLEQINICRSLKSRGFL